MECRACHKDYETKEARKQCELLCDYECETCGCGPGEKHVPTEERPDDEQISEWISDGVVSATDGCSVEPDGRCQHGHRSWLLVLGLI